jgi:hypothetical protein
MKTSKQFGGMLLLLASAVWSATASADVYTFNFTGRMTVADSQGNIIQGGTAEFLGYQAPISASLTYDTVTGLGDSPLSITLDSVFAGNPATFHDITLSRIGISNLFNGQLLVDYGQAPYQTSNMPAHIEWDATGLMNAIDSGLMQVGDKISGDVLLRDVNGDHSYSQMVIGSLGSATPYSDTLIAGTGVTPQYHAPLAATSGTQGMLDGPFYGLRVYLDIGSGNSMYLTSVTSVPEPASWAFLLSGLSLVGWAAWRRRQVGVRIQ